jgi:hypothetical protein
MHAIKVIKGKILFEVGGTDGENKVINLFRKC